jgi:hypothetical protein
MTAASRGGHGAVGEDPIDSRFSQLEPGSDVVGPWSIGDGTGVGTSPAWRAVLVLLPLGTALGPYGLNVLSAAVLSAVEPALPVAVAALGVLAGLRVDVRRSSGWVVPAASTVHVGLTTALVTAGAVFVSQFAGDVSVVPWVLAVLLGVCAAESDSFAENSPFAARFIDVGNLVVIVLGGVLLAFIREGSWSAAAWMTLQTGIIAVVIAASTWLLMAQTASEGEQRVFAAGALLLLGGVAEYLSLSALFLGLIGGLFWNAAGGVAGERLARDVRHVQHPLVVLVLLFAGARLQLSTEIATLVAAYVVCRTTGKLAGGWLVPQRVAGASRGHLGLQLIPAGAIAVAFAVNTLLAGGATDSSEGLLTVVVIGTIISELLSLASRTREAT